VAIGQTYKVSIQLKMYTFDFVKSSSGSMFSLSLSLSLSEYIYTSADTCFVLKGLISACRTLLSPEYITYKKIKNNKKQKQLLHRGAAPSNESPSIDRAHVATTCSRLFLTLPPEEEDPPLEDVNWTNHLRTSPSSAAARGIRFDLE